MRFGVNIFSAGMLLVFTSFYMFPFIFTFLPGVNTKMIMALFGLILFFLNLGKQQSENTSAKFVTLSLWACGVSLASLLSMVVNDTPDDSYLSYIVSMWVWLGGAYFIVNMIKSVHGMVSVELLSYYMIGVGVLQCLLAVIFETYPGIDDWVGQLYTGKGFMKGAGDRMHGIGCALDVGGGRLAVLIFINMYLLAKFTVENRRKSLLFLLVLALLIMCTIGNIIGRTAIVGVILGFALWIFLLIYPGITAVNEGSYRKRIINWAGAFILLSAVAGTALYYSSSQWEQRIRFGFEGFFSLAETGEWKVHSNELLQDGYVLPDNPHTWIVGDGYMEGEYNNPYYVGEKKSNYGFYMSTDAGYSRFLFYFGLVGLLTFSGFFIACCVTCCRALPSFKILFIGILMLNFAIWIKVSTDIFVMFAPFLCLSQHDENLYTKSSLTPPIVHN